MFFCNKMFWIGALLFCGQVELARAGKGFGFSGSDSEGSNFVPKGVGSVSIWTLAALELGLLSDIEKFFAQKSASDGFVKSLSAIIAGTFDPIISTFESRLALAETSHDQVLRSCVDLLDGVGQDLCFAVSQVFVQDYGEVDREKKEALFLAISQIFRAFFKKLFKATQVYDLFDWKLDFSDRELLANGYKLSGQVSIVEMVLENKRHFDLVSSSDPKNYESNDYKQWLSSYLTIVRCISQGLKGVSTSIMISQPRASRDGLTGLVYGLLKLFVSRHKRICYACSRYYPYLADDLAAGIFVLSFWLYNKVPCDKTLSLASQNRFKFEEIYREVCKILNKPPLYNPYREELS